MLFNVPYQSIAHPVVCSRSQIVMKGKRLACDILSKLLQFGMKTMLTNLLKNFQVRLCRPCCPLHRRRLRSSVLVPFPIVDI
jgi:hypothetical protein